MQKFDLLIIGSGPGGYVAAIRAAQLGMKTALIERYNTLGGTCLNVGCIPSKALLDSSEHYYQARTEFAEHGISTGSLKMDLAQMVARKNKVVEQTVGGIDYLMKKNKVEVFHGHGSFEDSKTVRISRKGEEDLLLSAENIIIATGSKPKVPPAFEYDKKRIITSTEALQLTKLPKSMLIIGAGVIGLELGSVFSRLGTEVTVVEYLERALPAMDKDCSKEILRPLKKMGMKFLFKHQVNSAKTQRNKAVINLQKRDGGKPFDTAQGKPFELKADYCLVAIGRRPYTDGLHLAKAGLKTDERGFIPVNEHLQTAQPHIYALGDVIGGAMLAHKAEEEGIFVVEQLAGQKPAMHYRLIPSVVYTWPEVASVGYTEEELKAEGRAYKTGKFPFRALGRARASGDLDGMVKVLADEKTDELLGIHIVGARAADLIAMAVALLEYRASAEDAARICYAHPTFAEAVKEAMLDATEKRPLHI